MKTIFKLLVTGLVALALILSGCVQEKETENGDIIDPENGGTTGAEMSFTTVLISDAPSDNFSHINVTFSQVKIHKYGNENDSGWILFEMEPKTIDLIYLHENNLSAELGVKNISVGTYSKLWIVVDGATGVLKETGEEITFDVPSGDLKIQQSFEIKEGNTTIDVELDLDRSLLYVPQGGVYKLTPQLGKMKINYEKDGEEKKDDDEKEEDELVAHAGDDYDGEVNETIQFNGSAEGGVKPYTWYWDFGDGYNSTEQNPTHAYSEVGEYNVTLTVTDDIGNTTYDEAIAYIYYEFEVDAGDEYDGIVGEPVQFNGNASGGMEPYTWYWDFGDGNTSTEQEPEHTYASAGNYTATLTVTDDIGNTASDDADVFISDE
jgi:chitodextrinase